MSNQELFSQHGAGLVCCPTVTSKWAKGCGGPSGDECQNLVFCSPVAPAVSASGPPYSRTGNERVEMEAVCVCNTAVRRLTPMECERLQGFPDGYTDIIYCGKPAPDGQRYKALGNSMAVPCMRWIGERIQKVMEYLENARRINHYRTE